MAIGPDGSFLLGGPINQLDRGGLNVGFSIIKSPPLGVMQFGTVVDWLAATIEEMQQLSQHLRESCNKNFGDLPYDKSTLPIKVVANVERGVIELYMPQSVETLVANPEVWLALAEVIDTTITSMKN